MTKGMLISFEGGEGSGKTTQITLLAERLKAEGKNPLMVREPGSTPIGEAIRDVVLNPKFKEMAFPTEVFLFQAQRAQLYSQIVVPELQKGRTILIDRTRDSSLIYQGIVREFGTETIEKLNTISTQNIYPDVTFLLDVSVEIGLDRRAQEGVQNRIDIEQKRFHQQVREAYLTVAQQDKKENKEGRWHIIDANQSPEKVAAEIWQTLQSLHSNL